MQALALTKTAGLYHTNDIGLQTLADPEWQRLGQAITVTQGAFDYLNPLNLQIAHDGTNVWLRRPEVSENWYVTLTSATIKGLIGIVGNGAIRWVEYDAKRKRIYVLFGYALGVGGAYLLRSLDKGNTWAVSPVYLGNLNYDTGCVIAGRAGGNQVYVGLNVAIGAKGYIYYSSNAGVTFAPSSGLAGGNWTPLVIIDPSDERVLYFGNLATTYQLYRSTNSMATFAEVDGAIAAGIITRPTGNLSTSAGWINPGNSNIIRTARGSTLYRSNNYWVSGASQATGIPISALDGTRFTELAIGRYNQPDVVGGESPHLVFVTLDDGVTMTGKAGANAAVAGGGGDSIGYDAAGIVQNGVILFSNITYTLGGIGAMAGRVMKTTEGVTAYMRRHWGFDPFEWLGECARIESISREQGDLSPQHCIDARTGRQYVSGTTRGAPGLVSSTVAMKERFRQFIWDELEECSHDFDRHSACKNLDDPEGWEEILRICNAVAVTPEHAGFDFEGDAEDMMVTTPLTAVNYHKIYRVNVELEVQSEAVSWVDVDVCHGKLCAGCAPDGEAKFAAVSTIEAAGSPYLAIIEFDKNDVATITTTALTDWTVDGANAVLCLGDYIFVISDGEALPILRSRDGGTAFTALAGNTDMAAHPIRCIDAISLNTILIGGEDGYVYASYDGGDTWFTVSAGVATTQHLNKIMICRDDPSIVYAVGAANAIIKSEDGGRHWFALTGPSAGDALTALDVYNPFDLRVGNDDGELWETEDGGESWEQADAPDYTAGSVIRDIVHAGCRVSYLAMADTTVSSFTQDTEQFLYRNVKEGSHWEIPTGGHLAVPAEGSEPFAVAVADNGNLGVVVGGNDTDAGWIGIIAK